MEMLDTILRDLKLNETALRRVLGQAPADELRTSDVTLVSHAHGRERRAERGIQRRELQAAIKHGEKVAANPGRRGEKRWRFTHQGVVYITDETMRHEITSWRLDGSEAVAEAEASDDDRPTGSHVVLVVDHSGSMRRDDVPGYATRTAAVYDSLARDLVEGQLQGRAKAEGMAVTLLEMSDDTVAVFENSALDKGLAKKLRKMGKRRARSHGNYLPALDAVLGILYDDAVATKRQLFLIFLSDGAPSDHTQMVCKHGVQVWQPCPSGRMTNQNRPCLQKCPTARECRAQLKAGVERACCQRLRDIGNLVGRDRVFVGTVAFGKPDEDYSVLRSMAATLPRNTFQKLGLSAGGLKTAFSSLTSSLTTMATECATTKTERTDVGRQSVEEGRARLAEGLLYDGEWDSYFKDDDPQETGAFLAKQVWDPRRKCMVDQGLIKGSIGVAHATASFGMGAERLVFHATECNANPRRIGPTLVAKQSKHEENVRDRNFHVVSCRLSSEAQAIAQLFNRRLALSDEFHVEFVQATLYTVRDWAYGGDGRVSFVAEPELEGRFTKWNNNAGGVANVCSALAQLSVSQGIIEEGDEELSSDEEYEPAETFNHLDVPAALSHFSYSVSQGRKLLCDIQGVHNAADGFTLTDPVLHTLSKRRNGSTDKGEDGMNRFFATHECNGLCRRLGLNPEPPYHDN